MADEKTFAQRLEAEREAQGLNRQQAAAACGMYRTSLLRLEEGEADPRNLTMSVAMALLDRFYPAITIADFCDVTSLRRINVTVRAGRRAA